jgi:hypothetical protein
METLNKLWSLEWSFSQKFFHIEPLVAAVESNLRCLAAGGATDYVIIGIFESEEKASEAADLIRDEMKK